MPRDESRSAAAYTGITAGSAAALHTVASRHLPRRSMLGDMIRNPAEHGLTADRERAAALRRLTAEDSIALGEALLTSEIMQFVCVRPEEEHRSLAIVLGITPPLRADRPQVIRGGK